MKKLFKLLSSVAVVAMMCFPAFAKQPIRTIDGIVTKVSDGDTIYVKDAAGTKVRVRFYGMDAPETPKGGGINKPGQPGGEEAHKALRTKIDRQHVRLDVMDVDQYGRAVGIVWLGNRNINREMVADGWAWAYKQYLDRAHASEYIDAEEQARKAHKGLWAQGGNLQPPWMFRRQLKIRDSEI